MFLAQYIRLLYTFTCVLCLIVCCMCSSGMEERLLPEFKQMNQITSRSYFLNAFG